MVTKEVSFIKMTSGKRAVVRLKDASAISSNTNLIKSMPKAKAFSS